MKFNKTIPTHDGSLKGARYESPNECPQCHCYIEPKVLYAFYNTDTFFSVFYYCLNCNKSFISYYNSTSSKVIMSLPTSFTPGNFGNEVTEVSPSFVKIYNQAKQAETLGLDEIAGIGYRKSLEFLAKDFAKNIYPDKTEKINSPKLTLSACINDYIDSKKLKDLLKATSWIGNDEAHYSRIHTDKDINDLKSFIDAILFFIIAELKAKESVELISRNQL